jgi:hypothetical protein
MVIFVESYASTAGDSSPAFSFLGTDFLYPRLPVAERVALRLNRTAKRKKSGVKPPHSKATQSIARNLCQTSSTF